MSDTRALELAAATDPEAHPRRWVILGVLCTSLLLVMQGNTALNLALPKIAEGIGLSSSAMQWVVDAYSLVFAGLLFTTSTSATASAARASCRPASSSSGWPAATPPSGQAAPGASSGPGRSWAWPGR